MGKNSISFLDSVPQSFHILLDNGLLGAGTADGHPARGGGILHLLPTPVRVHLIQPGYHRYLRLFANPVYVADPNAGPLRAGSTDGHPGHGGGIIPLPTPVRFYLIQPGISEI